MSRKRQGEPKYLTIAADLRRRLATEEFGAGTPLPPQRALSAEYGVSIMTLRQALSTLAAQGLIEQRAGRDTLVSPTLPAYRLDTLRSFVDDLRAQGHPIVTHLIGCTTRTPPQWVAEHLGERPALRMERVRLLAGTPVVHQVSWVPSPYAEALRARPGRGADRLYQALAEAGADVDRAEETIRPGLVTDRVARLLHQPERSPVLVTDRVSYHRDGPVVLVDRADLVGSALQIRTSRSRDGVTVSWGRPPSTRS